MEFIRIISTSLIIFIVGCSCDNSWVFKGKDNVGVDTIIYDNTISTNQPLNLEIFGNQINGDMFNKENFEYDRDTHSITGTFYADIYDYSPTACNVMPPTSLWPHTEIVLSPPFSIGQLFLIVNQPNALDTVGIITVRL